MKTLFIIDANSLIHRAYHALPAFTSPGGQPVGALYGMSSVLIRILKERKPDYIVAAFDRPEKTFREEEYPEYKGTRKETAPDLVAQIIQARELLDRLGIKYLESAGYEADDIIATFIDPLRNEEDLSIVVISGDMDLLQLVNDNVVVESSKKGVADSISYGPDEVYKKLGVRPDQVTDYKGLVGDASDNIPGIKGVGPKTAGELIRRYGSVEAMYSEIDELGMVNKSLMRKLLEGRESATLSKRLATLRRDVPLKFSLELFKTKPIQSNEELVKYFESLGFQSLITRLKY